MNNVYCLLKNNYSWVNLVQLHYVYISLRLVVPFIISRPTFYTLSYPQLSASLVAAIST